MLQAWQEGPRETSLLLRDRPPRAGCDKEGVTLAFPGLRRPPDAGANTPNLNFRVTWVPYWLALPVRSSPDLNTFLTGLAANALRCSASAYNSEDHCYYKLPM